MADLAACNAQRSELRLQYTKLKIVAVKQNSPNFKKYSRRWQTQKQRGHHLQKKDEVK